MAPSPELKQRYLQCVEDHADGLYRLAFRLLGNADQASDLVQETFAQAWAGIDSLKDLQKMRSWIFTILRFQYTKVLRKAQKKPKATSFALEEIPQGEGEDFASTEKRRDLLRQAMDQLDDKFRLPLLMVAIEGFSAEQAAEVLAVPKGTVLSRLHRGRAKLKETLQLSAEFSNE